jgi:hypothetical protein
MPAANCGRPRAFYALDTGGARRRARKKPVNAGKHVVATLAADSPQTTPGFVMSADGQITAEVSLDPNAEICPNCSAPRIDCSVTWCRKCGYHPALNRVIDLVGEDLDREQSAEPEPAKPSAKEGLALLAKSVPVWMQRSAMAAVAAGVLGVLARVATEPESVDRLVCALLLMIAAKGAIITAHVWSFFYAVPESDRLGIADLFVRPFYVWSPTMRDIEQPGVWRRPAIMAFGIVAEVIGLAVVGGIPWNRVWELGPAEPPKKALADAIANVGKAEDSNESADSAKAAAPARPRADCVIIGYVPAVASRVFGDENGLDFSSLVLASDVRGKLTYIGTVSGGIPDGDRAAIRARLAALKRSAPIVPSSVSATWVDPVLACRISYARLSDGRYQGMEYDKLLAELP